MLNFASFLQIFSIRVKIWHSVNLKNVKKKQFQKHFDNERNQTSTSNSNKSGTKELVRALYLKTFYIL